MIASQAIDRSSILRARTKMKLVIPSQKYKKSYLAAEREFFKVGEIKAIERPYYEMMVKDFSSFLLDEENQRKGINLRKGRVSQTRYWLIDEEEYIGFVSIRHRLNAHLKQIGGHIGYQIRPSKRKKGYGTVILKYALQKVKGLGIKKVLITCDKSNIGSRKIIEANEGRLIGEFKAPKHKPKILKYWIKIDR